MLRIAGIVYSSIVNGPGIRNVVYLQGCEHHCTGCQNMHTWSLDDGYNIELDELLYKITDDNLISGITISGGEPFIQYSELNKFIKKVKDIRPNLNILVYTGYELEELLNSNEDIQEILSNIDYIIDGKFQESNMSGALKYTGSKNQNIYKRVDNKFNKVKF